MATVELLIKIECDDYLCGECNGIGYTGRSEQVCVYHNGLILERGDVTNQFERLPECMEAAAKAKGLRDDAARIHWIDQNMDCDLSGAGLSVSLVEIDDDQTLRQAIDEAMAATESEVTP